MGVSISLEVRGAQQRYRGHSMFLDMFSSDGRSSTVTSSNFFKTGSNSNTSLNMPHIKEATSSSHEKADSSDGFLPLNYQLKTMCLAKKAVQMPNKGEHGFLLFCGLGARKWEVEMNCNSLTFKQAILNIYPRLRSVIGYNLYTVAKDKKTFEKIPEKVNTPKRIRSYLGSHFTGCLIIVPVSDIVLMEEKREHLRQIDMDQVGGSLQAQTGQPPPTSPTDLTRHRSLCLICGKIEKTPGTGSFYKIMEDVFDNYGSGSRETIVKKLTEILGFSFETSKRKFLASLEICKKCLRTCMDIVRLEEQVKKSKEEMISNFFTTTSKYNKSHGSQTEEPKINNHPGPYSIPQVVNGNPPFLVQPTAFLNPHAHKNLQYGNGYVQFLQPAVRRLGEENTLEVICPTSGVGSDYTPSEVGSSSFAQGKPRDDLNDEGSSCYSPKQFDTQSYASTFSFRSSSSIRSKAEIKSYDGPICVESDIKEMEDQEEKEKVEVPKCESNDTSPFSPTSPRSTTSRKSESLASSPGPDDKEEMEERMKPCKKRKIVQEPEQEQDVDEKAPNEKIRKKEDESNDSTVYQEQIDPSTSGSDNST